MTTIGQLLESARGRHPAALQTYHGPLLQSRPMALLVIFIQIEYWLDLDLARPSMQIRAQ